MLKTLNLIPPNDEIQVVPNGARGEAKNNTLMLDKAIATTLALYKAIDNGTDRDCVMAWVRAYEESGQNISPAQVREVIRNIYMQVACIHVEINSARLLE